MPTSKIIAWICGDCFFRNEGSEPGPCIMCNAPCPKRKTVVANLSTPVALAAVATLAPAKFVPKCQLAGSTHPSGLILDIVGIVTGDRGRRCKEHRVCCGDLVEDDIVVCLHMERILVGRYGRRRRYHQLGDGRCQSLPYGSSPAVVCT